MIVENGILNNLIFRVNNDIEIYSGLTLTFQHVLSKEDTTYNIDLTGYTYNENYIEIPLTPVLHYDGQYNLYLYLGNVLLSTKYVTVNGIIDETVFINYVSDNENNNKYIYIHI
jgi:hypothetical protein